MKLELFFQYTKLKVTPFNLSKVFNAEIDSQTTSTNQQIKCEPYIVMLMHVPRYRKLLTA